MSNETRNTASITSKVWSFCNPLRDVGVGYGAAEGEIGKPIQACHLADSPPTWSQPKNS